MNGMHGGASLGALALTVVLGACQARPMALPDDADPAGRMAVQGDGGWTGNSPIAFGGFAVDSVARSWGRGSGSGASQGSVSANRDAMEQNYRFLVRHDGGAGARIECLASASQGTVDVRVVEVTAAANASLECGRPGAGGDDSWQLTLRSERERPLGGIVSFGSTVHEVHAQAREVLGQYQTSGYEFRADGRVVAVVQTAGDRFVWMRPDLSDAQQHAIALAAAALLVYRELDPDTDD